MFLFLVIFFTTNTLCFDNYITQQSVPTLPLEQADSFMLFSPTNHAHYRTVTALISFIEQYCADNNAYVVDAPRKIVTHRWLNQGLALEIDTTSNDNARIMVASPWGIFNIAKIARSHQIIPALINDAQRYFKLEQQANSKKELYTVLGCAMSQKNSALPPAEKSDGNLMTIAYRHYMLGLLHEYYEQKKIYNDYKKKTLTKPSLLLSKKSLKHYNAISTIFRTIKEHDSKNIPSTVKNLKAKFSQLSEYQTSQGITIESYYEFKENDIEQIVCLSTPWQKIALLKGKNIDHVMLSSDFLDTLNLECTAIEKANTSPSAVINCFCIQRIKGFNTQLDDVVFCTTISESLVTLARRSWKLHQDFNNFKKTRKNSKKIIAAAKE